MASDGTRFTFTAGRTPDDTFAVVDFQLTQSLSSLFRLELTLASSNPALEFRKVLDQAGTLIIWQGEEIKRRLRGIVTFCEQGDTGRHQTLYHITLRPELWRSSQRQNCRSFQNVDIRAIFQTLLKETGVLTHDALFRRPHPFREFCVQYQETDFDFIARLAAEEGIFFCEEEYLERNLQKLTFADDSRVLRRLDPLPYNPNGASESSRYCINSFCRRAQIRPAQVTTQDYTFKAPLWPGQFNHRPSEMPNQRAVYEIFDYPGRFKDAQRGADFAKYQVEGWRSDVDYATGTSNSPRLQPGRCFSLTDHPRADLNDLWQVVSCQLTGSQPQALTGSEGQGTTLINSFSVIPAIQTWRSPPYPKPRVDGPQSAIVTGPPGEEIFCDEHGRVRVKFAWDRYNQADAKSSCWIRVSQAWAGAGFGNIAIPRVGQEVIVDFLNGDPDQPIITGRTYHAGNRAPGDLPGTRTQMAIRSQTYKGSGYNELMFEDETNQELLSMHAQKDMKTVVLNNRDTEVKVDHTETVGKGQTVAVGKKKEAGHDQKITVANDQTVTVNNDRTIMVEHDQKHTVTHDDITNVKNDQQLDVTQNRKKKIGADQHSEVAGDDHEKVIKSQDIDIGENYSLTVKESLTIKVGKCLLKMSKDGTITLNGVSIQLEGKDKINIYGADIDLD
ncbi:type VI secretion system tip protein TssI/VgrG [Buttiauxella gaviniae]|uniref:Type VI secretion system tip protein TssI/VgrG n=1 Tax=Buttiauxella gaviniae TaxID=82990 RepID=A0ABV3NP75_9ENTR